MINTDGRESLIDDGQKLIERLRGMTARSNGNGEIQPESLEAAIRIIDHRIELLRTDHLPSRTKRYCELSRLIVDEWPLGLGIGNDVTDWEQKYCKL